MLEDEAAAVCKRHVCVYLMCQSVAQPTGGRVRRRHVPPNFSWLGSVLTNCAPRITRIRILSQKS